MTTGRFYWRFGKIMTTLLNLDIDVIITFIIIILRKIKEQFMPRLMWSLSASSLVVRRQLATRPHDHLQLYIFFSIAIFGSNHLQHLPHDHLQPYFICNALATRSLHEKKIILLTDVKCQSTCDLVDCPTQLICTWIFIC